MSEVAYKPLPICGNCGRTRLDREGLADFLKYYLKIKDRRIGGYAIIPGEDLDRMIEIVEAWNRFNYGPDQIQAYIKLLKEKCPGQKVGPW